VLGERESVSSRIGFPGGCRVAVRVPANVPTRLSICSAGTSNGSASFLVKGSSILLIEEGEVQRRGMRNHNLTGAPNAEQPHRRVSAGKEISPACGHFTD
jgi:hypothetical protein